MIARPEPSRLFDLPQIWPATAALGVLFGIHPLCRPERLLHVVRDVRRHEIPHGAVAGRNQHYLHRFK